MSSSLAGPARPGTDADRGQVDDDNDVLVAAAGVPPHVLIDAHDLHSVEPLRSLIRTRCLSARTASLAVFHDTTSPFGDAGHGQVLARDAFQRPP